MTVKIDDLRDLVLASFRGDPCADEKLDRASALNVSRWCGLFDDLRAGRISVFWWDSSRAPSGAFTRYAVHCSTRPGSVFQRSVMMIAADGAVLPLSHSCGDGFDHFSKRGDLPDGVTVYAV